MADRNQQPIIIIKKKKGGHDAHHGGAWKVAYADFVTAMMAFFLLMWLLNVTTSDQRKGVADYFAPMGISQSFGGSGGVMAGRTLTAPFGADISDSSPPDGTDHSTVTIGKGEDGDEDIPDKSEEAIDAKAPDAVEKLIARADTALNHAELLAEAARIEEEKFREAEEELKKAIELAPELRDLARHLVIDRTPEGLRIQIIDQDQFSLFPSGSSLPFQRGRDLLRLVGSVIARLPNKITVTGHTDSHPFPLGSRRDNWDLSSERANVSRTELTTAGVPDARIARVVGLADRDPIIVDDSHDPRNRRISIVLMRMAVSKSDEEAKKTMPTPKGLEAFPSAPDTQDEEENL